MTNILIRDLPNDVHSTLQRRAEGRGQSLQQYLTAELQRLAARPTIDEVLERISKHSGGSVNFEDAVSDLSAARRIE